MMGYALTTSWKYLNPQMTSPSFQNLTLKSFFNHQDGTGFLTQTE